MLDLPPDALDQEWWARLLHDWESVLDMAHERLLRADAAMVATY